MYFAPFSWCLFFYRFWSFVHLYNVISCVVTASCPPLMLCCASQLRFYPGFTHPVPQLFFLSFFTYTHKHIAYAIAGHCMPPLIFGKTLTAAASKCASWSLRPDGLFDNHCIHLNCTQFMVPNPEKDFGFSLPGPLSARRRFL